MTKIARKKAYKTALIWACEIVENRAEGGTLTFASKGGNPIAPPISLFYLEMFVSFSQTFQVIMYRVENMPIDSFRKKYRIMKRLGSIFKKIVQ